MLLASLPPESPGLFNFPTTHPTSWLSPTNLFAFGFYQQGNGFSVGIWLVGMNNKTVVWTANRDNPPVTSKAKLEFTKDGKLLLITEEGQKHLIASSATNSVSHAAMLDSGNFVLYDKDSNYIWQSFDYPTDTILGDQALFTGGQLLSSSSESDQLTGRFHLVMQFDGNLVSYPANSEEAEPDAYWSTNTYYRNGVNFHLYLNSSGSLIIVNESNSETVRTIYPDPDSSSTSSINLDNNNNTIYSATLDADGIFRLYSHTYDERRNYRVSRLWSALNSPCDVKGFCGFNSFCTLYDDQGNCDCLPGHDFVDPNRRTLGCERHFSEVGCRGGKENAVSYNMSTMDNMVWGNTPYFSAKMTMEECSSSCLEDCNCGAALFKNNLCQKQQFPLKYVSRDINAGYPAFLKVGLNPIKPLPPVVSNTVIITSKIAKLQIVLLTLGFTILSCLSLATFGRFILKIRVLTYKRVLRNGILGLPEEVTLRLFTYAELKRATNGFKEELGKGSFGAVYKGALNKGKKLVAVKRLEKLVEEGEREFHAEMRAIGRTHHRNLVRLLGFCAEESKRLLVYEYMSNGSLADLLFGAMWRPDWNERLRIAMDVSRGVLYLHEECEAPIIHCDIKPQNILMQGRSQKFWNAKISDFGLAKFLMPDQTRTFTGVRGTRGYVAPEWHKNIPISVKADVYSYGIVLLEIVCCRKNIDVNASTAEEIVLSSWAYKCFAARDVYKLVIGEEVDMMSLEKMVKVGLWCIQEEPALRPSMKSVVLMLEGITEVPVPPCPTTLSM
ncbi:G-type lectin S-receptor-like serine/threonine-protein kinase LECRK3 [Quercus lobata]|uniref:G-type lectin S-receptor-like serine/threonine-protein kinase LECRK3 n=1 Tax=Quercus lobata TaxID=97700 RepID=UPI001248918E|nr:G-type lectin S-receptor-like serine/threonine-protein kinase LECRK3 [Quercus lobata]XP_030930575.1 G-type lectin S-receptor-like serine/threonine-protein kinase LECRK3 [Quercus lobata]